MKLTTLILALLILSLSCTNTPTNNSQNQKASQNDESSPCSCHLTDLQTARLFPISSINDSIVVCRSGRINGLKWIDFLQRNKFHQAANVFNCKTGDTIQTKYWRNSITYKNKSLEIYSDQRFSVFDSITHKWKTEITIDVYKEIVYSENGIIKKSKRELIFTPPRYNSEALKYVNEIYLRKKKAPHNISVIDLLLVAAMNGDSLSRRRLFNLSKDFPFEKEYSDEAVNTLIEFENLIRSGKAIKYLNLSI